jgi:hypothetical protein
MLALPAISGQVSHPGIDLSYNFAQVERIPVQETLSKYLRSAFDIIGSLPPFLGIKILCELPVVELLRCRLVMMLLLVSIGTQH